MLAEHDEGTIGRMLSWAIRKIAQDESPSHTELLRNVSSCKADVLSGTDCGREARRLFQNTDAFDADIVSVKQALAEGKPVINVVCRGYGNAVQKELTNLIIQSALVDAPTLGPESPDYDEDRRRRMKRLDRTVVGRRYFHYPTASPDVAHAQNEIERQMLGETRFDQDSRYNAVLAFVTRDPNNPLAVPSGDVAMGGERGEEFFTEMAMREDDLICDPDVPDSYIYPFLSETGARIGSYEADARRKRLRMRNLLQTHPDRMMQAMDEEDQERLRRAAVQMNHFYHALFNVQGVDVGEGWRFVPYQMDSTEVYSGADLSPWTSVENIGAASNFVNVSRGIPDLSEIGDFDDLMFDAEQPSDEVGTEEEMVVEPPASNGNFNRDVANNFIRWVRQLIPNIEEDRESEEATADAILERVYRAPQDVRREITSRFDDLNLVAALAALTSTASDEWLAAGPGVRAVRRELGNVQTRLQESTEEDAGQEVEEQPDSEELDAARERQEEARRRPDLNDLDLRAILHHTREVGRTTAQTLMTPDYAAEQLATDDGQAAHRMIENPTPAQLDRQERSLEELVTWWTNEENVPDYVFENMSPEAVYGWMIVSAPRFGRARTSLSRGGEAYVDVPLLERVYYPLANMRRAQESLRMKKLATYDPNRIRGYDDFRDRVVGTRGKRTSEMVRGRAASWALSNAIRQIVDAYQGVPLEPFSQNTASCSLDEGADSSLQERTFVVDVSELLGAGGSAALPDVDLTAGMTWNSLVARLRNLEVTLVSEDGDVSERNHIEMFAPINVRRGSDPIDFEMNPTGRITLSEPIRVDLGSGFRIAFPLPGEYAPEDADLLAFEYGARNVGKIRDLQSRYGVSVNRGPLPNWAPNPYCFIWDSGEATPNPNNLHNVVVGLRKRERLLAHHRQKEVQGGAEASLHKEAVRKLALEVEEMQDLVSWAQGNPLANPPRPGAMEDEIIWSPHGERRTGAPPTGQARFNANSLTRYVSPEKDGQPISNAFYEIVRDRCTSEGIFLPVYDATVDDEAVSRTLSRDQFRRFLQIKGDVSDDFKIDGRSVLVLDHLDNNVSPQHNNGIVEMVEGESAGGGREGDQWQMQGRGATRVLRLVPRVAEMFKNFGNMVRDNKRSHVIAITTRPIVSDQEDKDVAQVVLSIDIASPQIIEEYIRMIEAELQDSMGSDRSAVAKAIGFALPQSFIEKMKKGFSGLPAVVVRTKIDEMVKDLFEQYLQINDIGRVLVNNEEDIREKLSKMQSSSEVRDRLNIVRETPTVGYKEYVTETGTDWSNFIQGEFAQMAEAVKSNRRSIDMLSRCQDFNTFFGAMSYEQTDGGVVLHPSYAESGDLVWFSPDGNLDARGNTSLDAATERFGVTPTPLSDYLESIGAGDVQAVDFDQSDLSRFLDAFTSKLTELEAGIEAAKKKINSINVLYGGPGTGKTIFGDVLAKALDLHLDFCTFTQIFHAGGTSLRGQAEANVRDFLNYCRNARDTVMVIDEFDTFFQGSGSDGGAGDVERLRGELQVAWENDKPTYRAHNFYIVCTTNMTLAQMEANRRFQALKSRMTSFEVKLPKSIESMLEFFARGAAVNNLINLTCGDDDRLIEWGKRLVEIWDVEGEERQKKVLINSIMKIDPKFFEHTGILRPAMNRSKYLETIGVSHTDPIDPVEDWVAGWKQAQELFNRMERATMVEQTPEGPLEISWLNRIAKLMQDKIIYAPDPDAPDPGQEIVTRISLRELMAKIQSWIAMHGAWERGDRRALPLTYQTMWYGLAGTTFDNCALTEQQASLPHYLYLQDDPSLLRGEDGFKSIIDAVNTPGSGLTADDFMDEESVRYQSAARFTGASADSLVSFSLEHRIPQIAEKQFDIARRALRISGAGDDFGAKAPDIIQSLRSYNSTRYNSAAVMIERFVAGREAIAENLVAYEKIKQKIMSRPRDNRIANEDEREAIGELLVPIVVMARNGATPGLAKILGSSVFAAHANLPGMHLESIKNWMNIVINGYTRIADCSASCAGIAREMGSKDLETIIEERYKVIEASREEHMRDSSLRLSQLSPEALTPEDFEEFKSVLGLDFMPPKEDYDEIHRQLKTDISEEGMVGGPPAAEEPPVEEGVPVEEPPVEEAVPVEEPPVEEEEDTGQQVVMAPSEQIHLTPGFTGAQPVEESAEGGEAEEEEAEPRSREMPGSMVERIERRRRSSASALKLFKSAAVDDDTASRAAGWNNLHYISLLAQRLPSEVQTGPYNYVDHSPGLQGTLG